MQDDRLVRFFRGGANDAGRTHDEILAWDDGRLEQVHDYIQWLFPLQEPSSANLAAPVLDAASISAIRRDPAMQARLRKGFTRMLKFYGFEQREGTIVEGRAFGNAAAEWLHPGDHNHLRITRILRSLRVLGLEQETLMFWRALEELHRRDTETAQRSITERSYVYWKKAATEPLMQ